MINAEKVTARLRITARLRKTDRIDQAGKFALCVSRSGPHSFLLEFGTGPRNTCLAFDLATHVERSGSLIDWIGIFVC